MRRETSVVLFLLFMTASYSSSYLVPILGDSFLKQEPHYTAILDDGENDEPEHPIPRIKGPPDMEYVEGEINNTLTWFVDNCSSQRYEIYRSGHDDLNLNRVLIQSAYLCNGSMIISTSVDNLTAGIYDFSLYIWGTYYTCIWLDVVTVTVLNSIIPVVPIDNTTLIVLIGLSSLIIVIVALLVLKYLRYKK